MTRGTREKAPHSARDASSRAARRNICEAQLGNARRAQNTLAQNPIHVQGAGLAAIIPVNGMSAEPIVITSGRFTVTRPQPVAVANAGAGWGNAYLAPRSSATSSSGSSPARPSHPPSPKVKQEKRQSPRTPRFPPCPPLEERPFDGVVRDSVVGATGAGGNGNTMPDVQSHTTSARARGTTRSCRGRWLSRRGWSPRS